ncbi:hypothetical protein [Calditerricola satsumensis]|uniref:Uncharacterized protein n=1 Tax=Calditerricola satsumensis TaxID=373054 RepID=A0A8J3FCH4_9BACI|nr:hypothetical protein [Calditerricola satsumensis]GGJ91573.1 hypothetical protein GCM10007043_01590 [Calditerricola satsumensis]
MIRLLWLFAILLLAVAYFAAPDLYLPAILLFVAALVLTAVRQAFRLVFVAAAALGGLLILLGLLK